MNFGYSSSAGEITPSIFRELKTCKRTKLFLSLYNSCVESDLQIPLSRVNCGGIKAAFKSQINFMLSPFGYRLNSRVKSICLVSSAIINAYLSKDSQRLCSVINSLSSIPCLSVARLIQSCFAGGKFNIMINASKVFNSYVYDKISKKHLDKNVYMRDSAIFIEQNDRLLLAVLPKFSSIDSSDSNSAKSEIIEAMELLKSSKAEQVYIVCPRQTNFKRHIEVCHCHDGRIKIVPYSIAQSIF